MSSLDATVFVRRKNAANDLTYHRADCRYVRDKDDAVTVNFDEVQAAWDATTDDSGRFKVVWVPWDEKMAKINVCLTCLKIHMTREVLATWPPSR